jgi:ribonuclease-3
VTYSVVEVEGPPHDRSFTCAATIDGEKVGVGTGRSKKAAEQEAARQALEKLGLDTEAVAEA